MFKIIEQPNGFVKAAKTFIHSTPTEIYRLEFWNRFNEVIAQRGKPFNLHKPTTDNWTCVAIGSNECTIEISLVNRQHLIRVGLWIYDSKKLYDKLLKNKAQIDASLGEPVVWDRMDEKKCCLISS